MENKTNFSKLTFIDRCAIYYCAIVITQIAIHLHVPGF